MTEFEHKRFSKKPGFVATSALSLIAVGSIAAMCGGRESSGSRSNGENPDGQVDVSRNIASPTVEQAAPNQGEVLGVAVTSGPGTEVTVISGEAPTATVEAIPTAEKLPTLEEMSELIRKAYKGRVFAYEQGFDHEGERSAEGVIAMMRNCMADGQPITTSDGEVISPSQLSYVALSLSSCQGVGKALTSVYNATISNPQDANDAYIADQKARLVYELEFEKYYKDHSDLLSRVTFDFVLDKDFNLKSPG